MLKPILFVSTAILFAVACTPTSWGTPQDAAAPSKNPVKPTAESQAHAKKLYSVDCEMCHGANGNGKTDLAKDMNLTLSDWTDGKTLASKSDQDLFNAIRKGKDKMPPEDANRAKDAEVWNLVIYIRSMAKDQPAAESKPTN